MKTKKFIGLLLVLALCTSLLVGCELINNVSNLFGGGEGNNEALAQAYDELTAQCATAKRGVTVSLPATYTVGDVTFNIRWEGKSGVKVEHVGDNWIVSADGKISTEKSVTVDGYILDDDGNNLHNDEEDYYYHFVQRITLVPDTQTGDDSGSGTGTGTTTVKTEHAGTQADPYTVADALAVTQSLSADTFSEDKVYVVGYVNEITYNEQFGSYSGKMSDSATATGTFELYSGQLGGGATEIKNGAKVTVCGYLKNHKGMYYEIAYCSSKQDSPIVTIITQGSGETITGGGSDDGGGTTGGEYNPMSVKIDHVMPEGWTYVPNDPQYSKDYYYSSGALKLRFENCGVQSASFGAVASKLSVKVTVSALYANEKSSASTHVFEVSAFNASGSKVGSAYIDNVMSSGDYKVTFDAVGATYVKVVMVGFPKIDGVCQNVGIGGVSIDVTGTETFAPQTVSGTGSGTGTGTGTTTSGDLTATIDNAVPSGWQYVVTDDGASTSPSFYSSGALKMCFVNTGLVSPSFEAFSGQMEVKIVINALYSNQKSSVADHNFVVEAFDASGNVVGTGYIDLTKAGTYSATIDVTNAVSVRIVMISHPCVSGTCYNAGLAGVSITFAK